MRTEDDFSWPKWTFQWSQVLFKSNISSIEIPNCTRQVSRECWEKGRHGEGSFIRSLEPYLNSFKNFRNLLHSLHAIIPQGCQVPNQTRQPWIPWKDRPWIQKLCDLGEKKQLTNQCVILDYPTVLWNPGSQFDTETGFRTPIALTRTILLCALEKFLPFSGPWIQIKSNIKSSFIAMAWPHTSQCIKRWTFSFTLKDPLSPKNRILLGELE